MFFKKCATAPSAGGTPTEIEKAKLCKYSSTVKKASAIFTASSVLSFIAAVFYFLTLLTSFSTSTKTAVIGAIFTVTFLALGLYVNEYTKKESDFLCKVKRRPLGYLMRARISKKLICLCTIISVLCIVGIAVSFIIYRTYDSWLLLIAAILLILTLVCALAAFAVSEASRRYVLSELEFFDALETDFAKKTHRI